MPILSNSTGLITAEDLKKLLSAGEKVFILDATYAVPAGFQSPYDAFLGRHIEGSQFFDIDRVADQASPLPHTIPGADYFAACCEAMGISNDHLVVVYDQSGAYMASSRAWWMFRLFGHNRVVVLEGGLRAWVEAGGNLAEGPSPAPTPSHFAAIFRPDLLVTKDALLLNIDDGETLVVDARDSGRFHGFVPEPRPGMRTGHIPGSINLPFIQILNREDGRLDLDKCKNMLECNADIKRKMAVSCGSGVTACTVALALYALGNHDVAIYDGSWTEWGSTDAGTPIEVST